MYLFDFMRTWYNKGDDKTFKPNPKETYKSPLLL